MKYWVLLAEYDGESTTYTACAGSAQSSPYSPPVSGRLIGLRTVPNRSAASSLINHVQFKLTCPTFTPNAIECGGQGSGLQTAPALQGGDAALDWQVDQPVSVGSQITIEGRNVTADTPVTVTMLLYGLFDTK